MPKKLSFLQLFLVLFSLTASAANPVCHSFTPGNLTYSQDFDTLVISGSSETVPVGFGFIETLVNANNFYVGNPGSGTAGDTYSYGPDDNTDRAFGSLRSNGLGPLIGACFTNNTGATIVQFNVQYDGEMWRLGANTGRLDRLDFQYSLDATSLNTGTWTDVDALDFSTPNTTGTPTGQRNGNNAAFRTASITALVESLNVPIDSSIYFRWVDVDIAGSEDGLSIDNFSMTVANAGPSSSNLSISGRVVRADGRGIGGAYVRLAGGEGGGQMVLTNPFGYYRFAGLAAGRTFFLTAGAKRFTFAAPTRTVTLDEDIAGLDFVSEQ